VCVEPPLCCCCHTRTVVCGLVGTATSSMLNTAALACSLQPGWHPPCGLQARGWRTRCHQPVGRQLWYVQRPLSTDVGLSCGAMPSVLPCALQQVQGFPVQAFWRKDGRWNLQQQATYCTMVKSLCIRTSGWSCMRGG
jgi:hypothetical protein